MVSTKTLLLKHLAAQKSHRKIAVTTVAADGARNHSAAEIAGFFASAAAKKSLAASDFWVNLKIAGSSQRPWPQVAAAARFCGRSDHGTLSSSTIIDVKVCLRLFLIF